MNQDHSYLSQCLTFGLWDSCCYTLNNVPVLVESGFGGRVRSVRGSVVAVGKMVERVFVTAEALLWSEGAGVGGSSSDRNRCSLQNNLANVSE